MVDDGEFIRYPLFNCSIPSTNLSNLRFSIGEGDRFWGNLSTEEGL